MSSRKRVLFLYSELAGYFLSAARTLAETYDVEVVIVRWPVHPAAPFQTNSASWATIYDRAQFDDDALVRLCTDVQPDMLYTSGWMDTGYRRAAALFRRKGIPVVCGVDSQWTGALRQRLLALTGRSLLHRCYSHVWVAGIYQYEFARRLGFAREQILMGVYTADVPSFARAYESSRPRKASRYPQTLLYVGRLVPEKGVDLLCSVFASLRAQARNGWGLKIVGSGSLSHSLTSYPDVEIASFVQPQVLPALAESAGAFALPSVIEPWGVVLHEFAAAGLPLIASTSCGAASAFLHDRYNGFSFAARDARGLEKAMCALFAQPLESLLRMGDRSHELALQLTPDLWAATAYRLIS
jgi:glycosyltransferase involved in cell wall biosynthesis